jgi:hypothetical protein
MSGPSRVRRRFAWPHVSPAQEGYRTGRGWLRRLSRWRWWPRSSRSSKRRCRSAARWRLVVRPAPCGPSRRCRRRVVWVNGRSRPRRVMPGYAAASLSLSTHCSSADAGSSTVASRMSVHPLRAAAVAAIWVRTSWSALDRTCALPTSCWSLPPPATDLADPRRMPRRSGRRFPRHPENRRPTPAVLAAHGRYQARLRSATHWR